MAVGCRNDMVVLTPVTLQRTLTCVAGVARRTGLSAKQCNLQSLQSFSLWTTQQRWMQG